MHSLEELLWCKPKPSPIDEADSYFYATLMKTWMALHSSPPEQEIEIRREMLWHNRFIGNTLQDPILRKRWHEAGITTIQDVCHPHESRLMSHTELKDKFGVQCSFLEALQLRMAIPLHWRTALTRDFAGQATPNFDIKFHSGATLSVTSASPKRLYSELVAAKRGVIRAQRQWDMSMDVGGEDEWQEIYLRPFMAVRDTRLQAFEFRLSHRLITCNHLLFRYKIKMDDRCSFCDATDTMEHFFYQCPVSRRFWKLALEWIKNASGLDLSSLSLKEILLGVSKSFRHARRVNFLLLVSWYFIHRQRIFHKGDLNIIHWARELRKRLLTEQAICRAEGKPAKFAPWTSIMEYLG